MTEGADDPSRTSLVTLAAIREAANVLRGITIRSPLVGFGPPERHRFLKAESLQPIGAFKLRGAYVAVASLPADVRARGVITYSSGNHAQGVARAARLLGAPAVIVMPCDAPAIKRTRVEADGAEVVVVGTASDERQRVAESIALERSLAIIPPFDDDRIIAGQGTIGLELAEQLPELETVVVPIGGGGLSAGIGLALRALRPEVKIVGVQAAACAPLAGGTTHGYTIAEGIAVKHPGELTSALLADLLETVVTVTDEEISQAIVLLMERAKLVVEGAGAAAVAALVADRVPGTGPAVAILSGGNIDLTLLIQVMRHGLTLAGRYLVVRTRLPDRPGELIKLLSLFAEEHANVVSIEHHREGMDVPVTETEVEATLLTRNKEHCAEILDAMRSSGYLVDRLQ